MNFKKLFLSFDIFGFHPILLIDKKPQLQTISGSICTILITLLFSFLFFSSDFYQKKNPKIVSQIFISKQTPTIKISSEIFPIYLSVVDSYWMTYQSAGIFQLKVEHVKLQKKYNEKGIQSKIERTEIGVRKCQKEDIYPFNLMKNEEADIIVTKMNYYCLENKEFTLQGDIDEDEIDQMAITLKQCQNSTSDVICKSSEEIRNFFANPKKMIFSYVDFNEDAEIFKNEKINNLKLESYEIGNTTLNQSIGLKKSYFRTVSGISNEETTISIKLEEKKNEVLFGCEDALTCINLSANKKYEKITRTYQTIGESLASCFSIVNLIIFIMKLLINCLHKMMINVHLCNRMYDYDIQEEVIASEKKLISKNKNIKSTNSSKTLNLSFFQVLVAELKNIFWKGGTTYKEKLYLESENVIHRDTNITYIIQKLHEIDKIKLLLFNEKQHFLFNFISKPLIYLPVPGYKTGKKQKQRLYDSLKFIELINTNMHSFEAEIKDNLKTVLNSKKKIDKKLLMLLDQNLISKDFKHSLSSIPIWRRYTFS